MTQSPKFPGRRFETAGEYLDGYVAAYARAAASVDRQRLTEAGKMLTAALERDATIYVCGNGGSAAIANHLVCDHQKGMQTDTHFCPRVVSLSANVELITAIGNDIDFADVFVYPLRTAAREGDLLISISSSGNSENIVRAVKWAKDNGIQTIAFTGFSGGRSAAIADVNLHVNGDNYGVIEDIHQSFMHILAQYIRQSDMPEDMVKTKTF